MIDKSNRLVILLVLVNVSLNMNVFVFVIFVLENNKVSSIREVIIKYFWLEVKVKFLFIFLFNFLDLII